MNTEIDTISFNNETDNLETARKNITKRGEFLETNDQRVTDIQNKEKVLRERAIICKGSSEDDNVVGVFDNIIADLDIIKNDEDDFEEGRKLSFDTLDNAKEVLGI